MSPRPGQAETQATRRALFLKGRSAPVICFARLGGQTHLKDLRLTGQAQKRGHH